MKGSNNSESERLGSRSTWLERGIMFTGGIVVCGLIIETGPDIATAVTRHLLPQPVTLGGSLVIIGVAGEVILGVFLARIAERINNLARLDVAEALERARFAEKQAAEANLARAKLEEELYKSHQLTPEARSELVQVLKEYQGRKRADVFEYDSHILEVQLLADSINACFREAGWDSSLWIGAEPRIMGSEALLCIARDCSVGTPENTQLQHLAGRIMPVLFKLGIGVSVGVGGFSATSAKPIGGWGLWKPSDVAMFRVQIGQRQLSSFWLKRETELIKAENK